MQIEGEKVGDVASEAMDKVANGADKAEKKVGKLGDCFKRINAIDWFAVSNGIQNSSTKLTEATMPGEGFDTQLHELKSLTSATDEEMDKMADSARKLSKEFGGFGAQQLSSYQSILSVLGPEIAKNDEALAKMGKNAQVLSKTMQGDVKGATDALTNSLIQFKVNLDDPMEAANEMDRMMNVMTASAQAGSVEVPGISKALSEAGGVAKMSNLTFEETNALIQGMAKGGLEVEKIGVGARNILTKMAAPATLSKDATAYLKAYKVDIEKLGDTSVPFIERMKELNKVGHDMNALALIFGNENLQAAQAMLTTIDYQSQLQTEITGTNTAYEMASTVMEGWGERMKRYRAVIDDWKISLFDATAPIIPFVQGGAAMFSTGADIANIYSGLSPVFRSLGSWLGKTAIAQKLLSVWTGIVTAAQWAWNVALNANPIGLVIIAIAALVAIVVVAIKHFDRWGAALLMFMGPVGIVISGIKSLYDHWESVKRAFQTEGMIAGIKRLGWVLMDALLKPIQQVATAIDNVFNTNLAGGIKKLREQQNLITDGEKSVAGNGAKAVPNRKPTQAEIDSALKRGKLVMYNGKAVLPESAERYKREAEEKKTQSSSVISPSSILGGSKKKDKSPKLDTKGSGRDYENSINGGGGVKSIKVEVKMNNYFTIDKAYGKIDEVANKVVGKINDRLRDAVVAMD